MAAGDTVVTMIGNLTGDPELRFLNSGSAVASFTVASTPRVLDKDSGQWKDSDSPLFMRCSVWKQYAEHVAESLSKGDQVIVQGRLKQRSYEKDGQKRTVVELEVDEVGPTLRFATAKVIKSGRGNGSGGNGPSGGQGGGDWGSNQGNVQRSGGQRPDQAEADPWATSGGGRGGYDEAPPF